MPACPHRATCSFLRSTLDGMPTLARVYERLYCLGAWCVCARGLVIAELGERRVPRSLFPEDGARAAFLVRLG